MSSSKGSKRISVFDRLGPGNDESSSSTHRRYSSEKHVGSSGSQEKGRSHTYGPTVPSPHMRIEERESSSARDRKSRHRSSIGDYPSTLPTDSATHDDKRTLNPPPIKSSRDQSEVLKSVVGVKVGRGAPPTVTSPESDCVESGEESKRRKGYHSDRGRSKHESAEEDTSRRSGRGKDKGHGGSGGSGGGGGGGGGERTGSGSTGTHHRSSPPPPPSDSKSRSRREGGGTDHKRRKDDDPKTSSELGHKRKRDHLDDSHLPDSKRPRHSDHHSSSGSGRDADRHYGSGSSSTGKETGEHYGSGDRKWRQESGSESSRKQQHRSRSPRTPVPPTGSSGSGGERGARSTTSSSKTHKHSSGSGSGSGRDGKESSSSKDTRKGGTQDKDRGSKSGESSGRSKGVDWASLNSFTSKTNSKLHYQRPASVLKRFTPGAVFAGLEISPELAGEEKYHKIVDLVRMHVQQSEDQPGHRCHSYWDSILEAGGRGADSATLPASPLKSMGVDWDQVISPALGGCRRALTASDDYTLRRLLRKDQQRSFLDPVRPTPATWTNTGHYEIALEFYHALPNKPSGKPAQRVQASKVGTLVL